METTRNATEFEVWRDLVFQSGSQLAEQVSSFLPHLLAALAILLLGYGVARAVEIATGRLLRRLGLDRAAVRLQLAELLQRSEISLAASQIVAKGAFWIIMVTAVLSSVETIGLTAVRSTIDRLVAFIPNLIGASLIALMGVLAARVVGGLARSAAMAARLENATRLGLAAQWGVLSLVAILAGEQLGVATEILIAPLTAILGAMTLSAGLAVALGARPIVTHILAGHFLRRLLPNESLVVVDGERGQVERVGATETRFRGESKSWTIPNARLLDGVVTWV